jgi:peptidoglycan/LPS O-acetylase OafA/YrhL
MSIASKTPYRPDIDGLRAIAVLLVVVFHAFPQALPGGFAGVDIFFVISGFLISGIILDAVLRGGFSYLWFYARRCRRILPALLLVMFAGLCAVLVLFAPYRLSDYGGEMAGASVFSANFVFWKQAGYFDAAALEKPLRHLWSLAVEEQFYLLWPLILCVSCRRKWNLKIVLLTLIAASFAANIFRVHYHPAEAFYLLPARLWELASGALLAVCAFEKIDDDAKEDATPAFKTALTIVPPLGILVFLFCYATSPFPGWAALLPVMATVVYISNGPGNLWNRVLSRPAFVYIGKISYPLYLWHWPMLSMSYIYCKGTPSPWLQCCLAGLAFIPAALTYHLVETPLKRRLFVSLPQARSSELWVMSGAAGLLCALIAGCYFLARPWDGGRSYARHPGQFAVKSRIFKVMYNVDLRAYDGYWKRIASEKCFIHDYDHDFGCLPEECRAITPGRERMVLFWGDSHSERLMHGLRPELSGEKVVINSRGANQCPPVYAFDSRENKVCHSVNEGVMDYIERQKPHIVVMAADWSYYAKGAGFRSGLLTSMAKMRSAGVKRVIIYGQDVMWENSLPHMLLDLDRSSELPERIPLRRGIRSVDAFVKRIADEGGAQYLEVLPKFCNGEGCQVFVSSGTEKELYAFDGGHITDTTSDVIAANILGPALRADFAADGINIK